MRKDQQPTFRVIQGGLPDDHVEPPHVTEEELRASTVGQMLSAMFAEDAQAPESNMDYWDTIHGYGNDQTQEKSQEEQPSPKPPTNDDDMFDNVPL